MTHDITTPQEMFREALRRHRTVQTASGWACSCGRMTVSEALQPAFDDHVATFLAQLGQQPADANGTEWLQHGYLERDDDVSGVSGPGRVAEFFVFGDGTCALRWLVPPFGTTFYASVSDLKQIHGHGGATRLVPAIDEQPLTMAERKEQAGRSRKGA